MAVLKAQRDFDSTARQALLSQTWRATRVPRPPADMKELNIRANEDGLREMEAQSQRLLQQAASILTPPQLATLTQMESRKVNDQRQWVERL